jgi:hypothetical protein
MNSVVLPISLRVSPWSGRTASRHTVRVVRMMRSATARRDRRAAFERPVKLADASFLVDYARGDDAAITYVTAHDSEEIGASTIVLSELYRGLLIILDATPEAAMRSANR